MSNVYKVQLAYNQIRNSKKRELDETNKMNNRYFFIS